jgi:hypothetical protein
MSEFHTIERGCRVMNSSVPGQRGGRKTKQIKPSQFDCLDRCSSQLTRTASEEQQKCITTIARQIFHEHASIHQNDGHISTTAQLLP